MDKNPDNVVNFDKAREKDSRQDTLKRQFSSTMSRLAELLASLEKNHGIEIRSSKKPDTPDKPQK